MRQQRQNGDPRVAADDGHVDGERIGAERVGDETSRAHDVEVRHS